MKCNINKLHKPVNYDVAEAVMAFVNADNSHNVEIYLAVINAINTKAIPLENNSLEFASYLAFLNQCLKSGVVEYTDDLKNLVGATYALFSQQISKE